MTEPGGVTFSRYAFPPNELGHCGPPGAEVLLEGASADELRSRAEHFEGAWPYLELIARSLGIDDPLAPAVVSAYWLGGSLLNRVPSADFAETVKTSFGGQPGVLDRLQEVPALLDPGPSHAFHVFVVYPWIGLLHRGGDVARSILDQCQVRWGTVEWVDGDQAGVSSSPLSWDGRMLGLGSERVETRRWSRDGRGFVQDLQRGDQVSLHWEWICDRLSPVQTDELAARTGHQLARVNDWLASQQLQAPAQPERPRSRAHWGWRRDAQT